MAKKTPRRTAERILEASQELFNRFGEPNVSTAAISAELGISPGNLYYHYSTKDELVNALFGRYENGLAHFLNMADRAEDVEDAWIFTRTLLDLIWQYRFLYRDINDLLTRNRHLEAHFHTALVSTTQAIQTLLEGLRQSNQIHMAMEDVPTTATSMVVLLKYWLSFEYASNPRQALEPESAQLAMERGARHVLHLLKPYLAPPQRILLNTLTAARPLEEPVTRLRMRAPMALP